MVRLPRRWREILDRDRHTVQRTQRIAADHRRFSRLGPGASLLGIDEGEGIESRLHPLDAGERRFDGLDRRDTLVADQRRQLACADVR